MNPDEEQFSDNRGSVKGNFYLFAAKAYAFLKGRGYVTSQDVKSIGMDVLRHRVAIASPLSRFWDGEGLSHGNGRPAAVHAF